MAEDSIRRLRKLVSDRLGVDVSEMRPESSIHADLGADSLDVVELVMAIEEVFDLEISDEEAGSMRTVGDVESYVRSRVAA